MYISLKKSTLQLVLAFFVAASCSPSALLAQNSSNAFDSLYLEIAINILETDIDKALHLTDSLYTHSENKLNKTKSALLLALIYENKGNPEGIYWATKAEEIAIEEKNYEYQVRAAGYLATLYREVNLINESAKHIQIAEKANAQRKSESNYDAIQAIIHHEKYYHRLEEKNYDQALKELKRYEEHRFKSEDTTSYSFNLTNASLNESYAECYIYLEDYEKAKTHAKKALEIMYNPDPQLVYLLNNRLGIIALHNNNFSKAFRYLEKAKTYADQSENLRIELLTYKNLAQYYKNTKDYEKAVLFSEQAKRAKQKQIVSVLIAVRVRIKRQIEKYNLLMERVEADKIERNESIVSAKKINNNNSHKDLVITTATEQRLLKQLKVLEEKKFYLSKDITLASLTSQLNSNTRYVSQVIKTHKNKDFNNYINELRIYHVILLWTEEPEYLKYKLTYIANQVGFTSHSRFSIVFKNITGLTPSAFLKQLKKDEVV